MYTRHMSWYPPMSYQGLSGSEPAHLDQTGLHQGLPLPQPILEQATGKKQDKQLESQNLKLFLPNYYMTLRFTISKRAQFQEYRACQAQDPHPAVARPIRSMMTRRALSVHSSSSPQGPRETKMRNQQVGNPEFGQARDGKEDREA